MTRKNLLTGTDEPGISGNFTIADLPVDRLAEFTGLENNLACSKLKGRVANLARAIFT